MRVSPAPFGCTCPPGTGYGAGRVHLTGNTACALVLPPPPTPEERRAAYDEHSARWARGYVDDPGLAGLSERDLLASLIGDCPDSIDLIDALAAATDLLLSRRALLVERVTV